MPDRSDPPSPHSRAAVDCQGGQRMDYPDGSFMVTLPGVATVHCSRDGDITGGRRLSASVTIADLSKGL